MRSSAEGKVLKVGHMRGYGKYVVIAHAHRYATVYARMGDITVSEGESITAGTVIGTLRAGDNTLHFQIDFVGKPVNPLEYLSQRQAVTSRNTITDAN